MERSRLGLRNPGAKEPSLEKVESVLETLIGFIGLWIGLFFLSSLVNRAGRLSASLSQAAEGDAPRTMSTRSVLLWSFFGAGAIVAISIVKG